MCDAIKTVKTLPKHLAVIMDGNGRWAKKRGLPRTLGHQAGIEVAERIIKFCRQLTIKYLTMFVFSSENWHRSNQEVANLMKLLKSYLRVEMHKIVSNDIRIVFIGDREKLDDEILALMDDVSMQSANNNGMVLRLAISYGSRDSIKAAIKKMILYSIENHFSVRDVLSLRESFFDQFMNDSGVPDPDLLIRTGGEYRLSNFLLWEVAYTELYFSPKLWPEFDEIDLIGALEDFSVRNRRFGKEGV